MTTTRWSSGPGSDGRLFPETSGERMIGRRHACHRCRRGYNAVDWLDRTISRFWGGCSRRGYPYFGAAMRGRRAAPGCRAPPSHGWVGESAEAPPAGQRFADRSSRPNATHALMLEGRRCPRAGRLDRLIKAVRRSLQAAYPVGDELAFPGELAGAGGYDWPTHSERASFPSVRCLYAASRTRDVV